MRLTSIDIGTNTILMLIADIDPVTLKITSILDLQKIPRLGKGVDSKRNILPESINKAVSVLTEYKDLSITYGSERIKATATSFIRDAFNQNEFLSAIKSNTGIEVEILSGDEEAIWSFWGGVLNQLTMNNEQLLMTLDIGGGSTEITSARFSYDNKIKNIINKTILNSNSINIGSIRIKEKFLLHHPPLAEEITEAEKYINESLNSLTIDFIKENNILIGLAGSITTLGAIKLKLHTFEKEKVDGFVLTQEDVMELFHYFATSPLHILSSLGEYMQGRADIILPGTLILKCFMERFQFNEIKVSTKGLRYGLLLREVLTN